MNLDCQSCTDSQKEVRGCIKKSSTPVFNLDGEDYFRCPLKIVTKRSIEYVRFYNFYREGYLPGKGGILDQPGKFIDVMEAIDGAIREMEKKTDKKWRK